MTTTIFPLHAGARFPKARRSSRRPRAIPFSVNLAILLVLAALVGAFALVLFSALGRG